MKNQNLQDIKTYPEMNQNIKDYLEFRSDVVSLYALKRINELEKELETLKVSHKNVISEEDERTSQVAR
ncbi:MAG TPA: hypothetical protein VIK55_06565 [Paludibacter sp.]